VADVQDIFRRFVTAVNDVDVDALATLIHPDYVGEFPQSGERFRGIASFRAQLEHYPGGLPKGRGDAGNARLVADDQRWAITPGYTVLPLSGPQRFTAIMRTPYPDGSWWHVITIVELRDGLVWRATTYFAPEFEPPEWRASFTERFDRGGSL
jgi:hypothetical protein